MKKATQNAIKAAGLQLMDKAVKRKYGIDCITSFDDKTKKWISAIGGGDLSSDVTAYIAGYQQALNDMFIAARL